MGTSQKENPSEEAGQLSKKIFNILFPSTCSCFLSDDQMFIFLRENMYSIYALTSSVYLYNNRIWWIMWKANSDQSKSNQYTKAWSQLERKPCSVSWALQNRNSSWAWRSVGKVPSHVHSLDPSSGFILRLNPGIVSENDNWNERKWKTLFFSFSLIWKLHMGSSTVSPWPCLCCIFMSFSASL